MTDQAPRHGARVIGPEIVDDVLSRLAALDGDEEDRAFAGLVERQPHLVEFVGTVTEELAEGALDMALDLLVNIEAMYTEVLGAPLPTIPLEDIRTGSERAAAALEAALVSGTAPVAAQPHVLDFVRETVAEPYIEDDGEEVELDEDDRAELVIAFGALLEVMDEHCP